MTAKKSTARTTVPTGALVPQPHGGAIRNGGPNKGNPNAPGRPPSAIREHCRGSFADRVGVLEEIADSEETSANDRIRAVATLGQYGLGPVQGVPDELVTAKLRETIDILRGAFPSEQVEPVLVRLRAVWSE